MKQPISGLGNGPQLPTSQLAHGAGLLQAVFLAVSYLYHRILSFWTHPYQISEPHLILYAWTHQHCWGVQATSIVASLAILRPVLISSSKMGLVSKCFSPSWLPSASKTTASVSGTISQILHKYTSWPAQQIHGRNCKEGQQAGKHHNSGSCAKCQHDSFSLRGILCCLHKWLP